MYFSGNLEEVVMNKILQYVKAFSWLRFMCTSRKHDDDKQYNL